MAGRLCGILVDVDRVPVTHRVEPVVHHRLVDRMACDTGLALALGLDPFGRRLDVLDRSHLLFAQALIAAHGCLFFAQALITAAPSAPSDPTPQSSPASPRSLHRRM